AAGGQLLHELGGVLVLGHRLLEVDDVNLVAMAEDIGGHLGVPVAGLVTEVDDSIQHFAHEGHEILRALVLALRLYRPYGAAGTLGGIARDFLTIRMDKPETGWPIAARRTNPDDRGGEGLQCAFNARAPAARAMPASTCAIELAKASFAMTHFCSMQ